MAKLKLKKQGGSLGTTWTKELLAQLGAKVGDDLHVVSVETGRIVLSLDDPEVEAAIESARRTDSRYRTTLKKLAE